MDKSKLNELITKLCYAFYNQGVMDGDDGELDKFHLTDEYDNNYEVFSTYFQKRDFINSKINYEEINLHSDDPLWCRRVWREDDTFDPDEDMIESIREYLQEFLVNEFDEVKKKLEETTAQQPLRTRVLQDIIENSKRLGFNKIKEIVETSEPKDYKNVYNRICKYQFEDLPLGDRQNILEEIVPKLECKEVKLILEELYKTMHYITLVTIFKEIEEKKKAKERDKKILKEIREGVTSMECNLEEEE